MLIALIFMGFIAGCATIEEAPLRPGEIPSQGIYHKVRSGETIWRIAKMYNVSVDDVVLSNKIPNVAHIEKNQLIFIPGARATAKESAQEIATGKSGDFAWPLKGKVISYFGDALTAGSNRGIDIQSAAGETVSAAQEGRVVFADYLTGYGYMVIIGHANEFYTTYAQNSALLVKVDDVVTKGMPVAKVGENGKLAFLHFEIRKSSAAVNPLYYLP